MSAPIFQSEDLSSLTFHKSAVDVDGGLFYNLASDPMPDGGTHYVQLGLDYATTGAVDGVPAKGSYLALYDNKIDADFVKFGVVGPWAGGMAVGVDAIIPGVQLSVHDFFWMEQSLDLYSQQDGIRVNGRAAASDGITIQRDDTLTKRWYHYHQGNGSHDWRWGMMPGVYDLAFYAGNGDMGCSASNPGTPALVIREDGTLVNKTIAELESRIATLEKLVLQKAPHTPPQ